MKAIQIILVAIVLFGMAGIVSAQDKKENSKDAQIVFAVNMHCHNCEQKIKKNIPYEKGVKDLTTDLDRKQVIVKYRTSKTDKEKLKKAIEKLGYTCEEVPGKTE
jgi:copper chaperone CopZ